MHQNLSLCRTKGMLVEPFVNRLVLYCLVRFVHFNAFGTKGNFSLLGVRRDFAHLHVVPF